VLAPSEDEAERRFEQTRRADPFPAIPSALLNTADLLDYVAATGMIHPLSIKPEDVTEMLKPASCGIRVLGPYLYWPEKSRRWTPDRPEEGDLRSGDELVLERNSIVYVTLEPTFRLPDYIAGRFNLTIRDVYRGLLVGTGPLVDPGFQGRLSLPLHNLTANDYTIVGGEPLVWMEFTKLSPNQRWRERDRNRRRSGVFVPFPRRKLGALSVRDYVRRAHPGSVRSSIPVLIGESVRAAKKAQGVATTARGVIFGVSLLGAAGLVGLGIQVNSTINDARDDTNTAQRQVIELRQELREQQQELRQLRIQIARETR
jgi:deoxycytidine triphosphate deaminase